MDDIKYNPCNHVCANIFSLWAKVYLLGNEHFSKGGKTKALRAFPQGYGEASEIGKTA